MNAMNGTEAIDGCKIRFSDLRGLELFEKGEWTTVNVKSCFPWSSPDSHLSLLDNDGAELLLVKSLEHLEGDSKRALQRALAEAQFCFSITDIQSLDEEFELWNWTVSTTSGNRIFQTKINHWPQVMPDGQVLIRDLHGDTYVIEYVSKLPDKAKKLVMPLLE